MKIIIEYDPSKPEDMKIMKKLIETNDKRINNSDGFVELDKWLNNSSLPTRVVHALQRWMYDEKEKGKMVDKQTLIDLARITHPYVQPFSGIMKIKGMGNSSAQCVIDLLKVEKQL